MSVGAGAMSESIGRDSDSPPPGSNSTHCTPDGLGGYNCTTTDATKGTPESSTRCYPDGLGGFICEEGY